MMQEMSKFEITFYITFPSLSCEERFTQSTNIIESSGGLLYTTSGEKQNPKKPNERLFILVRKVDGSSVKLGLQVVYVSSQENECDDEDTDEDGGSLVCLGTNLCNDSVLSYNLDTCNVVASIVVC
mmetsp:Transcript_17060/g.39192  ORF Transcript_17060/g.39192 Transcript_17060/m.39192 type:complete len:126 (-) Transcript_17060:1145-1522(-)